MTVAQAQAWASDLPRHLTPERLQIAAKSSRAVQPVAVHAQRRSALSHPRPLRAVSFGR